MKIVALLHDIGKPSSKLVNKKGGYGFHNYEKIGSVMVIPILKRFGLKNERNTFYIQKMVEQHGLLKIQTDVTDSAIRRLDQMIPSIIFDDLFIFSKCDLTTKYESRRLKIIDDIDFIRKRIDEVRKMDIDLQWRSPIKGNTIKELLNITQGKIIGDIKKVTDEKIKSGEWTEKDGLDYILSLKDKINFSN